MAQVTFKTLGRSSLYAGIAEVWRILSRFVLTPIIIGRIGLEGYGTWTLLFSVCGYVDILNMSFGFAYNKFTAEHDRRKDYKGLSEIVSSGIVLVGTLGLAAISILWVFRRGLLGFLGVPPSMLDDASASLLIVTGSLLLRMSLGCVFNILAGLQRLDLHHKLAIFASIVEFIASVALLARGHGLLALAIGHLIGQIFSTALAWMHCLRLCPGLHLSARSVTRPALRRILSLGGRFQLLSGLTVLFIQGVKMLISALCGVSILAVYELADKLLQLARAASGAVINPLMPAFANLHAGGDKSKWRLLICRGSKLVALAAVTCLVGLVTFADRLIVVWTGEEFELAAWTIRVMAMGHFLWVMTGVGTASLRGRGSIRLELHNSLRSIALAAVLAIPGYILHDFVFILLAVQASRVITSLHFLYAFARLEGRELGRSIEESLIRAGVIGIGISMVGIWLRPTSGLWLPAWSPRWTAVFEVASLGSLMGVVTYLSIWFVTFTRAERLELLQKLPFARRWTSAEAPVASSPGP